MTAQQQIDTQPVPIKKQPLTRREADQGYKRERSFVDFLPWVEYLDDHEAVLLEDGRSVGAVFEINPIGTAGRTQEHLASVRDTLEEALADSFEEYDRSPWIIQTYTFDDTQIEGMVDRIRDYATPDARDSQYTAAYMEVLREHYTGITREGGLFVDNTVTQAPWGGMRRRNYMVIYRKLVSARGRRKHDIEDGDLDASLVNLNEVLEKFTHALKPSGASLRRLNGAEFHDWLLDFFNPSSSLFGGDRKAFLAATRTQDDTLPYGDQFAESLFYDYPRSDKEQGCWWFGASALRCISIDGIRRRPFVGHVTGETKRGDATNALMDMLPAGSVFASTIVVIPQDTLEGHIDDIDESAIGDNSESIQVRKDCIRAREILGERHKMYRAQYAVYLRGQTIRELDERTNAVRSRLLNYGFRAIAPRDDFTALDAVIRNLPMVYDADRDAREGWRGAQITVVQHIANLSCLFGRSRGTGNPGIAMFNRGGEPLYFDPLNSADRQKNAHMLVLGPSGAGKSATLVSMLAHVMAVHRPRLFVIEAGNSFGLLGDWYASQGLTVNRVALKPGSGVSLSPFQDAHSVLDERPVFEPDEDMDEDDSRDIMGEMEIVAQLMITGGEAREAARMTRSDRRMIRDAILSAAAITQRQGRPTLTQDVRDAFYTMSRGDEYESDVRRRLREMGDAIGLFCDGFSGELFNNAGTAWKEADVTIIDLATFAREGYEAHLAISVVSCLNMINNIAERDQFGAREIVVTIDEAHIVTTNPLLAPFLVKIVKMWRKLGAWLWSATQNMEDYPDAAKKMLNMVEWWLCLVMPKEEVEAIARFRRVDDAQRDMLLSASKAPGQYTEGVVMSEVTESIFRNVPPSLMLALAQTEKHEKAHRMALMREHGISEVEAAIQVAKEIDVARGIRDA
ncbi:conjugative transfer ATPase [Pseudohalioglobus lutimaris]|uniref:conjugative transfer ATPase n=1 Tax=Pseudohalioglobus lutimaris TaxID=1737061 RepID=UPI001A9E2DEC|nr:conjugative transfer ATPase [Pseudohalioglobus lutimaris]